MIAPSVLFRTGFSPVSAAENPPCVIVISITGDNLASTSLSCFTALKLPHIRISLDIFTSTELLFSEKEFWLFSQDFWMFHSLEGAAAERWAQVWKPKICSRRAGAFWPLRAQQAAAGSFSSCCGALRQHGAHRHPSASCLDPPGWAWRLTCSPQRWVLTFFFLAKFIDRKAG